MCEDLRMEKAPGSDTAVPGEAHRILEGVGESERQSPKGVEQDLAAARGSSLAPPLLLISCAIFCKLLTLSGP